MRPSCRARASASRPVPAEAAWVAVMTEVPALIGVIAPVVSFTVATPGVALRTGLYLAQAGEFGFVLLALGALNGLVAPQWVSPVLACMVLSMLATPFIIMHSNWVVMKLSSM